MLPMDRFTKAVEGALIDRNWYAALALSLALPDICAKLESQDGRTSGARYAAWFEQYMARNYQIAAFTFSQAHRFLTGDDFYALRCSMLHEGSAEISHQRSRDVLDRFRFVGGDGGRFHCNQGDSTLHLSVERFCMEICDGVARWQLNFRDNHPDKHGRLDRLLTIHSL